jgi:hypothetical protein
VAGLFALPLPTLAGRSASATKAARPARRAAREPALNPLDILESTDFSGLQLTLGQLASTAVAKIRRSADFCIFLRQTRDMSQGTIG